MTDLEHEWDKRSVDFPLNENSVVVEVGAYKGRWAKAICDLYQCNVFAFEPQFWAYEIARTLLDPFYKVRVYNYGLGVETGTFEMGEYETDGCSFLKVGQRESGAGKMKDIAYVFLALNIKHVDAMLINIEGYEYTLIPYMYDIGMLNNIDVLMVQWHKSEISEARHAEVEKMIAETHDVLWTWPALTAWRRRP